MVTLALMDLLQCQMEVMEMPEAMLHPTPVVAEVVERVKLVKLINTQKEVVRVVMVDMLMNSEITSEAEAAEEHGHGTGLLLEELVEEEEEAQAVVITTMIMLRQPLVLLGMVAEVAVLAT